MSHSTTSSERFSQQWSARIASLSGSLERNDRLRVSLLKSFDSIKELFPRMDISLLSADALQELNAFSHDLEKLKNFMRSVSNEACPPIDDSTLWGLLGLVVQLSQSEEGVAPRVPRMLCSVCQNIDFLNKYREKTARLEIRDTCFHVAISLLSFLVAVIKFIREDVVSFSKSDQVWEPLEQQFNTFNSEIDQALSRLARLENISKPLGLDNQLQSALTTSKSAPYQHLDDPASLPCFIYPTSRTLRFFDRTEDVIHIDRYFNNGAQVTNQPFRSLTLYGIGGVGKSSVALRYAETRIHRKEVDAMFWIAAEKENTIRQSFTDVAVRLKLPGAGPKDHDQNRTLVLDWLQNTECQWLLIFDNVESLDILMTYWPTASQGHALITARNHTFAFYPADGGLEITEWDTETGSRFLAHLLSTDIGNQLTEEKAHSAHELSLQLGGHALALSLMAGLIHRRSWSIEEFVEIYTKNPQKVHRIFGNSSINALWDMSFRSLSERTSAILGVLAFLSPDSIPQSLFEPKDPNAFPDSLQFCKDPFDFSDEMEILMTLALVKRNKEQRAFSIHRLLQTSFKQYMSPADRQKSFNDASVLVSAAFPRKDAKFAQMYHTWKQCSPYLPHVLSLRDCFREEKKVNPRFSALMQYCAMNNACQRYLIETNGYNDLLDLLEVNAMAILTIPPQPLNIQVDLEGELASHSGQALARVGRVEEAIQQLKLSYEIFARSQPRNFFEETWCAKNLGDGLATANKFLAALDSQEKARDNWLEWAKDNSDNKTEWPGTLKWYMGNTMIWAGKNAQARKILTEGLAQLKIANNWAFVAYTHYSLGLLDRVEGNFKSAEKYFAEAHNKWIAGDNLLSDPFCGSCLYRMGCVALDQSKRETAIKHLRAASVVTERHKVRMPAEHARSLFKLSEALAEKPESKEESKTLRDESIRLLRSRSESQDIDLEKTYDDLIFIWWR